MSKRDRLSAEDTRVKFNAEIEDMYSFEQRDEAKRLIKENPARGRTPKSTIDKVETLRARGVETSLPPFEAKTPEWVQDCIDGWKTDEIRAQEIGVRRTENLEGTDKKTAQLLSVESKTAKLEEVLGRYAVATGKGIDECTDARPVAVWAVDSGAVAQSGATRAAQIDNLTKRLRRMLGLL